MAEQTQTEYDQYAPQANGRLFSNAMFGFNKEQVLEYLEDLTNENNQRQEVATQRIQELDKQLQKMEMNANRAQQMLQEQQPTLSDEELQRRFEEINNALQIARDAGMQAEDELAEVKDRLHTAQNENNWLREEHQKTDKQVAELRRQLDEASQGQWFGAEEQIAELRRREEEALAKQKATEQERDALVATLEALKVEQATIEAERDAAEAERDAAEAERDAAEAERDAAEAERDAAEAERELLQAKGVAEYPLDTHTTKQLVAEATEEAEHIRKLAYAERDRLHRQVLNSAGGLVENISSIREDITAVEGEVTNVLENVQEALAELLVSLNHTEQNLNTLDIQIERFPSTSPSVAKHSTSYLQPVSTHSEMPAEIKPMPHSETWRTREKAGLGNADFHRVWPKENAEKPKAQLFRPSFSNSSGNGAYFSQAARALPRQAHLSEEDRMKALTDTLVDTLRQMLD